MKQPPISVVLRRIRPLSRFHQICHLRGVVASLPRRSIRRGDLEAELKILLCKQLRRESKAA